MSLKKSLYTVRVFARLNTRRFFRDKLAIFFTILFPLIFLFVFGGLTGKSNNVRVHIALVNDSQSAFSKQFVEDAKKNKIFDIDEKVTTVAAANDKLEKNQLDGLVYLPQDFGQVKNGQYPSGKAEVVYTQNNQQAGQALSTILQAQFDSVNKELVKSETPFTVVDKPTNNESLSPFDYTFAGLLGFAIIGMGIFGPVNVFPELKKQGILRRLHTTPVTVAEYFMSTVVSQVLLGFISIAVMFGVAMAVFDLHVVGNIFALAAFIALGIIMILGIGLALGGWAKNERQVAPLANIIVFPMMFLSGTFFPRFAMPEWLQSVSAWLPLTPVIDGIRLIATEGKTLIDIAPQVGLVGLWMVVIYIIAFRVFRWE